ncbi:TniQ family protein [Herbaspirillum hiltneri]|uniref:TniQ family protein n=1 Tax=Herbaspirillum hiltneri TaxID=341045 RepID=UPI0009F8543E|nr:TniQ family protein [Herbaspirillum hiltneri]
MPLDSLDVTAPIGKGYLPPRLRLYGCPLPLADESLSSWLLRVSANYIIPVKEIIEYCFGKGLTRLFCVDPDVVLVERIQQSLASKFGISAENFSSVASLTPRNLDWPSESWLVENLHYALHRSAFCPHCLASDSTPYFRNQWRYTTMKECSLHNCLLLRKCLHCNFSVHPYRHKVSRSQESSLLAFCPHCKNCLHLPSTGIACFDREKQLQLPRQESATKPLVTNPTKKKQPKEELEVMTSPQISVVESVSALDPNLLDSEWRTETDARYLMCLRNPTYRLNTILQKSENYRERIAETVARRFLQMARGHVESETTAISPPFCIPSLVADYLKHEQAQPSDLLRIVHQTAEQLHARSRPAVGAREAQLIEAGLAQCEAFLSRKTQL